MGLEVDLLANYPKSNRNLQERANTKTQEDRDLARKFGKEFFDGDRSHGYGGFNYNPRFWTPVIPTFQEHWNLKKGSKILDVGCAKGFMLYDLKKIIPGVEIAGIDISEYAISNSLEEVKPFLKVSDCRQLPFQDKSYDVVISINTIHNLEINDVKIALKEISRVSKGHSFVTVDAYRNEEEKTRMFQWNLTAKTILSVSEWIELFKEVDYTGDYYWFIP
jgi:SAM-dependent methyltransferase